MSFKGHLRDTGLGLCVTAVLLVAAEATLALFGIGDPGADTPLSRGFDENAAYLVPDPEVPGGWRTQFSDDKWPERRIPPKGERTRVVLFGGSNTQQFPAAKLQSFLDARGEGKRYEVVNLGRVGYGSERVLVILKQALARLDPDVVVIYSGHNEFLERGFRMELEETWSGWTRPLIGLAARSRTVHLLAEAFEQEAVPAARETPEAWKDENERFADQTYDQTQVYFDAFENNLRAMCAAALEQGVGVVLCTTIYNRFAAPFVSTFPPDMPAQDRERFEALHEEARALLPDFVQVLRAHEGVQRVHGFDLEEKERLREEHPERTRIPGRRACFGPLATQDPGLPEPWRWSDKAWDFFTALAHLHARDLDAAQRADVEHAETLLGQALALCPDHPAALFDLALTQYLLGREESVVVRDFELAARYDRAPRKSSEATNERVHRVAEELEGVTLFPADELFASRMPMGLTGYEWMIDYCHLVPGGREVLMRDLALVIAARWP